MEKEGRREGGRQGDGVYYINLVCVIPSEYK